MKKVFYLSSCGTCKRIMADVGVDETFEQQDIKKQPISAQQLDELAAMAGGYEPLFSRISQKYKTLGLKDQNLSEADYRQWILDEYTMLKRPVFVINQHLFIGNAPKTTEAIKQLLANN
ncbi:MAG: arsenate reductase [Sphingobacteriales bacterium]|nr:arsenate reductase [Sphingobacteriales bacterium]